MPTYIRVNTLIGNGMYRVTYWCTGRDYPFLLGSLENQWLPGHTLHPRRNPVRQSYAFLDDRFQIRQNLKLDQHIVVWVRKSCL